jgi:TadE-like protein
LPVTAGIDTERGQASVELVAVLPAVILIGAVVWQLALAGHAAWLTANAARAAARAEIVGRSAGSAARSALPRSLEHGLEVKRLGRGRVRISVRIPWLLIGRPGPIRVAAVSSLCGKQ